MNDFIIERNIERYAERLRTETDPVVRARVKALLIEEENHFGFKLEQLNKVNGYIVDSQNRIEQQKRLIEQLQTAGSGAVASSQAGYDLTSASRLLSNMEELLALFEQYRLRITDALARHPRHPEAVRHNETGADWLKLTEREVEVLSLAAQGNTSDQIANVLRITRRTVEAHVQAILPKLDATNGDQAVAIALNAGIIKFN